MNEIAFTLLLIVAMLAFANWRAAFALCVLTALLQDPLRKLVPGQPVYFVVFVGVVFAAAFAGAYFKQVQLSPTRLVGWRQYLGKPMAWFMALAAMQCLNSLMRFGNPIMTGIGLMSYFAPIPAIVLAYRFALSRNEAGLLRFMRFYVVAATLALCTVYLEYAGLSSRIFGEVGEGVMISGAGAYYKGNSGIFRAAEIAAWHAATVACFAFILFWGRRFSPAKVVVALLFIAFLLGIGALTGRRKMIIEIAIFLSTYFFLISWYRRSNTRIAVVAALLGVIAYAGMVGYFEVDTSAGYASERVAQNTGNEFGKYSERASTVFEDLPRRLLDTGASPIMWAVEGYGWMGGGLGIGSQGAQHFGVEPSGAAEGGLGKLTVELGVPGLFLIAWVLWRGFRYVTRILSLLSKHSPKHANFAYGLVAFLVSNLAAFSIATQAYADMFILLTLGWALGFLLALPSLAGVTLREGRPRPTAAPARAYPVGPVTIPLLAVPDAALLEYTRRTWDT